MGVTVLVSGELACFTRPELSVERVSYDVMTPSAAIGILESIHWKPAIKWIVDRIHVLKPIRWTSIKRNEVKEIASPRRSRIDVEDSRSRIQRHTRLLRDVAYVIEAHLELTDKAGADDNEGKHLAMFNRRLEKGQHWQQPCLGCREFPARIEPVAEVPAADNSLAGERDLGLMLHSLDHTRQPTGRRFYRAVMRDGMIEVPAVGSAGVLS